ncbi:hypothetical protein BST61_g11220 [Cercospora zeina]
MPPDIEMGDANLAQARVEGLNSSPESAQERYACQACGLTYSSPHSRDRHMRLHTGEKRFACPFPRCDEQFARRDYLTSHWLTHENALGSDFAALPPDGSMSSRMVEHVKVQRDAEVTAAVPYVDRAPDVLGSRGQGVELPVNAGNPARGTSDKGASSVEFESGSLARTLSPSKAFHASSQGASTALRHDVHDSGPKLRITAYGTYRVRDLDCLLCDKGFGRPSHLTRHLSRTHKYFSSAQNGTTDEQRPAKTVSKKHHLNQASPNVPALVCDWEDCRLTFTNNGELIRHRKEHGDLRPVKCPVCAKGLSRFDKLKAHMKLHHRNQTRHSPELAVSPTTSASKNAATATHEPSAQSANTLMGRPHVSQRPTSGSLARYYACHLCDYSFERLHDLKRHLISKKHTTSGETPSLARVQRRASRPGKYQCPLCPKSFDSTSRVIRHVESSIHNRIVIGPSSASNGRPLFASDLEKRDYAQECVGCRQVFVDESNFFSHAPCYKPMEQNEQRYAAEVQQEYSEVEESEDDAVELDDFQAQLVAAANRASPGDAVGDKDDALFRSPRPTATVSDSHAADAIQDADQPHGQQCHRAPFENASQIRHPVVASPPPASALNQQTVSRQPPAEHQSVPASDLSPLRTATRMLIGARENAQGQNRPRPPPNSSSDPREVRRCSVPNKEAFWNHAPCFTTAAQPVVRSQSPRVVSGNDAVQRSVTPDKHDSGREIVATKLNPPAMQLNDSTSSESLGDAMPSLEVTHLLISIAHSTPEARPIPPWELARLTGTSPALLETVTRMEKGDAELQRTMRQSKAVPPSLPRNSASGNTSSIRNNGDGVATRPKIRPKTERTSAEQESMLHRSPKIAQLRAYHLVQPNLQSRSGHERAHSSAGASRGILGSDLALTHGSPRNGLQHATSSHGQTPREHWQGREPAVVGALPVLQVRQPAVSQNASLRTISGLRLADATSFGLQYERIFEDDTP